MAKKKAIYEDMDDHLIIHKGKERIGRRSVETLRLCHAQTKEPFGDFFAIPSFGERLVELPKTLGKRWGAMAGTNYRVFLLHKKGEKPIVLKIPRERIGDEFTSKEGVGRNKEHYSKINEILPNSPKHIEVKWVKGNFDFCGDKLKRIPIDVFECGGEKNLAECRFKDYRELKMVFNGMLHSTIEAWKKGYDLDVKPENFTYSSRKNEIKTPYIDLDRVGTTRRNLSKIQLEQNGADLGFTILVLVARNASLLEEHPYIVRNLKNIAKKRISKEMKAGHAAVFKKGIDKGVHEARGVLKTQATGLYNYYRRFAKTYR